MSWRGRRRAGFVAVITILDEIGVGLLLLMVLPLLGFRIPVGYIAVILALLAVLSLGIYKTTTPALARKPAVGIEAMAGLKGKTLTFLNPEGLVRVEGEVWKARAAEGYIEADREITVKAVQGLRLLVEERKT
ncbi:NfeD family protein [Candidatus Hecatella orcuttiae]|jgi:membrane-bound ClpP family serine protease|uniref:NfeD family protein n=1 Tax=Candidatus Hecatella orcuttiae TaxID=1935119 RepID=UPI002867C96E|nr:NfeD family protein [Candidatus Hecatella orcuttiae]